MVAKRKKASVAASSGDGVMMILSPAKTMDLSPMKKSNLTCTWPDCDDEKTRHVASVMRMKTESELSKKLGISTKLAKTAKEYWKAFQDDASQRKDLKPSIYCFSGAAFQGLDIGSCTDNAVTYMQQNLRILDAVYGVLRPLDYLQPYRLEMGTRNFFLKSQDTKLSEWWKPSICKSLSSDLEKSSSSTKLLLNLASDEYSTTIDPSLLPDGTQYVKIVFRQDGRTVAVHAKRARGLMVRYMAENNISDMDGVRAFSEEGYRLVDEESSDERVVFDRPKQDAAKAPPEKKTTKRARKK